MVDIYRLYLARGHSIIIEAGDGRSVEVVHKHDGTLQVCVDDETFEAGIHHFEDIYGPDSPHVTLQRHGSNSTRRRRSNATGL